MAYRMKLLIWPVLLCTPIAANAASITTTTAFTQTVQNFAPPQTDNQTSSGPASSASTARSDSIAPGGFASAGAAAVATVGRLSVSAGSSAEVLSAYINSHGDYASPGVDASRSTSEAIAQWHDQITLHAGGYTGGGYITAVLILTGSNYATNTGGYGLVIGPDGSLIWKDNSSSASLSLFGSGLTSGGWDSACAGVGWAHRIACARTNASDPSGDYSLGAMGSIDVTIPLSFLGTADLGYILTANSYAEAAMQYYKVYGVSGAVGLADMFHTLLWGGVTGAFDAEGLALNDYSILSDSGFDYLHAASVPSPSVPGPGTLALLGLGFAGLAYYKRRHKTN